MRNHYYPLLAVGISVWFAAAAAVRAQVPALIPVQGTLADSGGEAVDGQHDLSFRVFDNESADGDPLFSEDHLDVPIENGRFSIYLGGAGGDGLDLNLFRNNPGLWLQVIIDGTEVLSPLFRMGTAPFAAYSERCGDADTLSGRGSQAYASLEQSLGGLTCAEVGYVAQWDGADWICAKITTDASYTDSDARNAMGELENNNPYHHHRYTNAEAQAVCFDTKAELTGQLGDTYSPLSHQHAWDDLTDLPATYPPSSHTHHASHINAGELDPARIPDLSGSYAVAGHHHDEEHAPIGAGGGVPSGAVMFFDLPSCPAGWTELVSARGRFLAGKTERAESGATFGVALSDGEDRVHHHGAGTLGTDSAGSHDHTVGPTNTESAGQHNHRWSAFDAGEDWNTYDSSGAARLIVNWGKDWAVIATVGNGPNLWPLALRPNEMQLESSETSYFTNNRGSHSHSISQFDTGSAGSHNHSVVGNTAVAATSDFVPSIQFIVCRKN